MYRYLLFFLLIATWETDAQPREASIDLKQKAKILKEGSYIDYEGQETQSIHIAIDKTFQGKQLELDLPEEYGVFIDGKLVWAGRGKTKFETDSLFKIYSAAEILSIYAPSKIKSLQIQLLYADWSKDLDNSLRFPSFYKDFVILACLILLIFFVILFRSNTNLTLDYLNISKVFLLQSREEAITTGRIGSSANLLFFLFISACSSLLLMVVSHWGYPSVAMHLPTNIDSFGWLMVCWLLLSLLLFLLLIMKLVLIWSMTKLFNFKDTVRFQYFNFVRSLYGAMIITGFFAACYFIGNFQNPTFFNYLLWAGCAILILSTVFLYFKLLSRTGSSLFHLFSYLCGSEIIPLMILIKVLLF